MESHESRVSREAEIYDHHMLQREGYESMLAHANEGPARMRRDQFVREAVADLNDKTVLEIGTQAWAPMLNKFGVRPRSVTCVNISQAEVDAGKAQAEALNFRADFRVMDAHKLDFPANHFDFVYGVAILHHLDLGLALAEISRVTKTGGRILFVEPLRLNPIAQLVRFLTPKARTPDERPLSRRELRTIDQYFDCVNLFTELFYVPAAVLSRFAFKNPENMLTRSSDALDKMLVTALPGLGLFYRTVTIYGRNRG
jgi:SAM-dependent methyltransferase